MTWIALAWCHIESEWEPDTPVLCELSSVGVSMADWQFTIYSDIYSNNIQYHILKLGKRISEPKKIENKVSYKVTPNPVFAFKLIVTWAFQFLFRNKDFLLVVFGQDRVIYHVYMGHIVMGRIEKIYNGYNILFKTWFDLVLAIINISARFNSQSKQFR